MKSKKIPENAIKRNISWIKAVESAISAKSENDAKNIMKAAGKNCAKQIMNECEKLLGKKPKNVKELIEATNQRRRNQLKLNSLWKLENNTAYLKINECGCTLVKAGLAEPNPVHCLCTAGMFETLFTEITKGKVKVEVLKTIGDGDECCEFKVYF